MILLTGAALAVLGARPAQAQSLAEAARQYRASKPAPPATGKIYTNDNLPGSGAVSTTGPAPAEPPSSAAMERAAATAAKDAKAEAQAKEERAKLEAEWRGRFKKQRDTIALAEREAAALDREIKLRPAGVACATSNLCNDKASKEQNLAQEKQKLEDMKDQLRKAELPESWAE